MPGEEFVDEEECRFGGCGLALLSLSALLSWFASVAAAVAVVCEEEEAGRGTKEMHSVPENRTTETVSATGSTAEYGFG
ncbi:hypothetical protein KEM55_000808 [Ascosphaera atra]|nr:hypothetical protein KEM55_000808 [Ascosphaera atra]